MTFADLPPPPHLAHLSFQMAKPGLFSCFKPGFRKISVGWKVLGQMEDNYRMSSLEAPFRREDGEKVPSGSNVV